MSNWLYGGDPEYLNLPVADPVLKTDAAGTYVVHPYACESCAGKGWTSSYSGSCPGCNGAKTEERDTCECDACFRLEATVTP